jgi:hypothetical protein
MKKDNINNNSVKTFTVERWQKLSRIFASLCFLATAMPMFPVHTPSVYAQQVQAGGLSVEVLDSKGSPLTGATVKVYSADNQEVGQQITNEKGLVQIPSLPKGTYRVEITAEKYEPYIENAIEIVDPKTISRASIQLSEKISPVGIDVEVKAESDNPIAHTDLPTGELTQKQLRTIPTITGEFDEAIGIIPNVIRPPDGKVSIKGARENQSAFLVNGSDGTDPATGDFTKNIPLESIEQIKVYTNPYLPEYGRFTGGVTKVETRRGGDKFKFDITDIFPEPRFRGGKLFGFANVSPRIHMEGPLIKNKLYFSQGLEYAIDKKPVRGLASPDNEIKKEFFRTFTQLDYIFSPTHTLTTTISFSPRKVQNVGLDFFNPKLVSPNQKGNDFTVTATDRFTLPDGSLIETIGQYKRIHSEVLGKGNDIMTFTPLIRQGNYFHHEQRTTERYQVAISDTLAPKKSDSGSVHNIKIGADINYLVNDGITNNNDVNIVRADGTKAQTIHYFTVGSLKSNNAQAAAFVQDQWLVRKNFSVDYGIRFEAQRATAGISAMPRLAASYSPDGNGRTVLRSAVGLFYDKVPLNVLSFLNAPRYSVTTFASDGSTITDARSYINLVAPRPNGKSNNGSDFAAPRNLTFNFELNQKLNSNTLLKVAYLQSRTEHDLYVSPVVENGVNAIKLFNDGENKYKSLEVTTSFKLPQENSLSVSYIRSRATGELNDFNTYYGDFPDPILRPNQLGRLSSDAPNRLLATGTFNLPYKVTITPLLDIHTGFPYSMRDELQNFVGVRNSARFPRFASLDMSVSKDIRIRDKYTAQFIVSMFNVTNHFNPRNVKANIDDPGVGTFFANYKRFYRLDFSFMW